MNQDSMGLKEILVVEEEPGISRVCEKTLMGDGYDVDIVMQENNKRHSCLRSSICRRRN